MVQVKASNILPANFLIQGLMISALFEPFGALCTVATAEIIRVCVVTLSTSQMLRVQLLDVLCAFKQ